VACVLWLPDRMGCHNLDSERAGLCPRGGETAIDDFSVGHNLPIPVASRTVPGQTSNIEFRNLVLAFAGMGAFSQTRQGRTLLNAQFSILGNQTN
jgi:hypothetical protein